jgi:ATP-dependent DNA helicase RecQ
MTLEEVQASLPEVPGGKVRVVLAALERLGQVARLDDRRFVRVDDAPLDADAAAVAEAYEARRAADRERLERMVLYAQTARCRWKALLEYFGEPAEWDACGHCDSCRRPAAPVQEARHHDFSPEGMHLREAAEPPPLPPLAAGDPVLVPVHGAGAVTRVEADKVEVRFADGATRKFKRSYVGVRS